MPFLDRLRSTAAALTTRRRRVWSGGERVHVEIRELDDGELDAFVARLEEALLPEEGVQWVEAYPHLGRVVVAVDLRHVSADGVVAAVDTTEGALGVADRPFACPSLAHPADRERLVQDAARLGADLVGVGIGVSWRLVIPAPGTVRAVMGSVTAVINGVPRVRETLCSRFDWPVTDIGLSTLNSFTQGLAVGPLGPLTDLVQHLAAFGETLSRRQLWEALEPELFGKPEQQPPRALAPPRPGPLPAGPVERFEDRVWPASFSAAGVVLFTLRDPRRAAAVMEAAIPKPARYGKETFAAHLGRALAARGVLVLDARALRVLDRVDCLVVEGSLLTAGDVALGEVVLTGEGDRDEIGRRIRSMFDPATTGTVRRGEWRLGPVDRLQVDLPDRTAARIAELARGGGSVLGLARGHQLRAVVRTRPVLLPEGQDLLVIGHRAGLRVVVALSSEVGVPAEADDWIADGEHLAGGVRALQAEGRVVCVVGTSARGLAVADCAVGVRRPGDPTPWSAHLLCPEGLRQACFVAEATAEARGVSTFSARAAMAASGAAGALALRPLPGVVLRAGTVINGAALVTMAEGTRRAVALHRRPRPLPRDPTPWHAMEPETVLGRLGSSPDGLTEDEARRRLPVRDRPLPPAVRLAGDVTGELATPLTPLLCVGAALSLATGAPVDAIMVTAVVGLNAVIGGVQKFRAAQAFSALERRGPQTTTVVRGTDELALDAELVVAGDILQLRAGDAVTADCRIIEASWLEVDESSLTGESFPVTKDVAAVTAAAVADRSSMLYDGTFVAAGEALAVVVATGGATEARRAVMASQGPPHTGVEARLGRLTDLTIPIALGSGAVTVALGLLRRQPFAGLAAGAVSLAVADRSSMLYDGTFVAAGEALAVVVA
ncbi:MAG: hypothetical protein M3357_05530, partial [Actinomycetota bacterium]|nr:hypothetical protein [Actinomycetota bacterium]